MKVQGTIIAIDGFSSTGKSSFAKMVAKAFGLLYLDSGALYRAFTLYAVQKGEEALRREIGKVEVGFAEDGETVLEGRVVEREIRSMEVSSRVSSISALPYVRERVDEILRLYGRNGGVVMDGRDIGTTVFPEAQIKVFMTASEEVRTQRRYDEMKGKGLDPDMEEVRRNLRERDRMDMTREISPLRRASDAFLLDNSAMTFGEELSWIQGLIQGKLGILE